MVDAGDFETGDVGLAACDDEDISPAGSDLGEGCPPTQAGFADLHDDTGDVVSLLGAMQ